MAGWLGYYNKTTYESLAGKNPWLAQPTFLLNTRIKEIYGGFKGSAGSHFTYNAKIAYQKINNQPLFVNDTITGKSFNIVNESSMDNLQLHGELGYTMQEKFSFMAGASFNHYTNLTDNEKAWGMLPVEINAALRWQIVPDVLVKKRFIFLGWFSISQQSAYSAKVRPSLRFERRHRSKNFTAPYCMASVQ